jgi:hypothetical protein
MANPGRVDAHVRVTFAHKGASPARDPSETFTVPANRRATRNIRSDMLAIAHKSSDLIVTSDQPIVVERVHYAGNGGGSAKHTTPEIATFAVLRRKGQLEAIWRVRDAAHVWLQGRLVSSSGAMRVPAGASSLRLEASNDVGSRQRLLHLVPPAAPRPRPTATPTAPPTATPVPPPTATPTARPAATSTPRPSATPTARPPRTPTPVSVTVGTTQPPVLSRPPVVPAPRPRATPTPVSVTIGSTTPPGAAVTPTPTAGLGTWP